MKTFYAPNGYVMVGNSPRQTMLAHKPIVPSPRGWDNVSSGPDMNRARALAIGRGIEKRAGTVEANEAHLGNRRHAAEIVRRMRELAGREFNRAYLSARIATDNVLVAIGEPDRKGTFAVRFTHTGGENQIVVRVA